MVSMCRENIFYVIVNEENVISEKERYKHKYILAFYKDNYGLYKFSVLKCNSHEV